MSRLRLELPDDALDALAEVVAIRVATMVSDRLAADTIGHSARTGWLTTKQAAEYLGMTPNALHKLTSAREIPFSQDKPGGRCWFKVDELDAWRFSKAA